MEQAGALLAAGALVVIRGAFEPTFAERLHRSLESQKYEEHFRYHHHNISPDLAWFGDDQTLGDGFPGLLLPMLVIRVMLGMSAKYFMTRSVPLIVREAFTTAAAPCLCLRDKHRQGARRFY
jgi:hypothetical protein